MFTKAKKSENLNVIFFYFSSFFYPASAKNSHQVLRKLAHCFLQTGNLVFNLHNNFLLLGDNIFVFAFNNFLIEDLLNVNLIFLELLRAKTSSLFLNLFFEKQKMFTSLSLEFSYLRASCVSCQLLINE